MTAPASPPPSARSLRDLRSAVVRSVRASARRARGLRALRPLVEAADRLWWGRVISRAQLVDPDLARAQGFRTARAAVRAYVRGGFRRGVILNPLVEERLIASQFSDVGRVPALYAYLINDTTGIRTSVSWDAFAYARAHPDAPAAPGGPVGHAWRQARASGRIVWGVGERRRELAWADVSACGLRALQHRRDPASTPSLPRDADVIVCEIGSPEEDLAFTLEAVTVFAAATAAEVVLCLEGTSANDWLACAQLSLWTDRVVLTAARPDLIDDLRHDATDGVLVVRGAHGEIDAAALTALAHAATTGPVAPLWIAPDGTIASAGVIVRDGRYAHLLEAHPAEDVAPLGTTVDVSALAGRTFALPRGTDAVAPPRTLLTAVVRARRAAPPTGAATTPPTDIGALLAPGPLRVAPNGRLHRVAADVTLADGTVVPSLRWAIRTAAPAGRPGEYWGDTHFARGLADALRRLGQEVVIDSYAARRRPTGHLDDVMLALRGPEPIDAAPASHGTRSFLWIISHPDELTAAQLEGFDRVYAASSLWAHEASIRFGRTVVPLLQCTDAHRFRPEGIARTDEIVFVGTARGIARPSVVEPIRAGIPVRVYGPDWTGYIPAAAIVQRSIPNAQVPSLYERAAVVLNDHWPAMQRAGFISNRLYDVVAAGGRAISDEVSGIAETFGAAVQTFTDTDELIAMLRGDLDARFPDDDALALISAEVRARHSFDARARELLDAAMGL